jgi:Lrp/AsnC family transcriptional regulator, leucine-responsive regulatory protein
MHYLYRLMQLLTMENEVNDDIDIQLLQLLSGNARASLKELGAAVGLSSPSVAERVRRLEERGVIRRFTIEIDPAALGYQLQAIIRIRPLPGQLHMVRKLIEETPEIVECDKITGDDCFIARLHVRSVNDIDPILDRIAERASTNTSIVKSKTIPLRHPPMGAA